MTRSNTVKGPTSALSSFLRERGISAIPHWRQRIEAGDQSNANENESDLADVILPDTATEIVDNSRSDESMQNDDLNGSEFTVTRGKITGAKRSKKSAPLFYLDAELHKKPKNSNSAPSKSIEPNDSDNDGNSRCNRCRAPFSPADKSNASLCKDCVVLSTVPSEKQPRKKVGKLSVRPVHEHLLEESFNKTFLSLRDLCVKTIIRHIEDVESFGIISDEVKDRICKILCKHRLLDDQVLQLFFDVSNESLSLYDCAKITDDGLKSVAQFNPFLKKLFLQECGQMTDGVALYFGQHFLNLTELTISGGFLIKDAAMAQMIFDLPSLQSLSIEYSPTISRKTLDAISAKPHLTQISIRNCIYIDSEALLPLSNLVNCSRLDLSFCPNVTDDLIESILPKMANLTYLALSGCHLLSGKALNIVALKCTQLKFLFLSSLPLLLDDDVSDLAQIADNLEEIDLGRNLQLTGRTISDLPLFGIKTLILNGLSITDSLCLETILGKSNDLVHLDVSWIPAFGDAAMDIALQSSQKLKQLVIWGCHRITEYNVNKWIEGREGLTIEGATFT